jgi:Domain of unknown function (DUF3336)
MGARRGVELLVQSVPAVRPGRPQSILVLRGSFPVESPRIRRSQASRAARLSSFVPRRGALRSRVRRGTVVRVSCGVARIRAEAPHSSHHRMAEPARQQTPDATWLEHLARSAQLAHHCRHAFVVCPTCCRILGNFTAQHLGHSEADHSCTCLQLHLLIAKLLSFFVSACAAAEARGPTPCPRSPGCTAGLLLAGGLALKLARFVWTLLNHAARRARTIQARMECAASFQEWQALASDLDAIRDQSRSGGVRNAKNELYDSALLAAKVAELESLRQRGNVEDLMFSIRSDLYRDFGNITNRCEIWHISEAFSMADLLCCGVIGGMSLLCMNLDHPFWHRVTDASEAYSTATAGTYTTTTTCFPSLSENTSRP